MKHGIYLYINELAWLCWQSVANASLLRNSLIYGKLQGKFQDLAANTQNGPSFLTVDQSVTPKFPCPPEQGIFWR